MVVPGRARPPRRPPVSRVDAVRNVDLCGPAGEVGALCVTTTTERRPGLRRDLQPAVVTVACVEVPVAARLTLRNLIPLSIRGTRLRGVRGGRHQHAVRDGDGAGDAEYSWHANPFPAEPE